MTSEPIPAGTTTPEAEAKTAAGAPAAVQAPKPIDGLVVGRKVYYHPLDSERTENEKSNPQPWSATVIYVVDPIAGVCHLNIHPPYPTLLGDNVYRQQNVSKSDDGVQGTWTWMYDGQATRGQSK